MAFSFNKIQSFGVDSALIWCITNSRDGIPLKNEFLCSFMEIECWLLMETSKSFLD